MITTPDTVVVPVDAINHIRIRFHQTRLTKDLNVAAEDIGAVLDYFAALAARPAATPAGEREAALIIACHLPQPAAPDSVCIPITMTARDLRTVYAALSRPTPVAGEAVLERLRDLHRRNPSEYAEVCSIIDALRTPTPEPAAPDAAGEDDDLDPKDYTPSIAGLDDYLWNEMQAAESIESRCILEQWRDALIALRARSSEPGGGAVGSAEREVGRAVYKRIEVLMQRNPSPASSDWVELDYLSHLAESVEEIDGYDGPLTPLATPHPGASSSEPADARGGEDVWTESFIADEEDGPVSGICIDLSDGSQIWTGDCSTALLDSMEDERPDESGQFLTVAIKGKPTRVVASVANVDDGIALARALAAALSAKGDE